MGNIMDKNQKVKKKEFSSIKSLRNKCISIYKSINVKDSLDITLNKYLNALNIDNTNFEIVEEYIKFLYSAQAKDPNPKKETQYYHLFFENSKKNLFDFLERLKNYENNIENKIDFFQFLYQEKAYFSNTEYNNNLPIPRMDNNLYYSKLYEHVINVFYRKYKKETEAPSNELKRLIEINQDDINKIKINLETEYLILKKTQYYEETIKQIENIYCCDFFNNYISKISEFVKKIDIFIESLKKTSITLDEFFNSSNNSSEFKNGKLKLLENFLYYLEKRPFTIENNPIFQGEYYTFIDSVLNREEKLKRYSNDELTITVKDEDNVFIKYKNCKPIIFNDKLYSLGYFCDKISKEKYFKLFEQKFNFSEYNSNNIFRKNWENTRAFIKDIFGSRLMKELMKNNDLFDIYNENEQNYLDEILEEVYFYPFFCSESVATTNSNFGTIYIQGELNNVKSFEDFIILYCFQIVSLMHELFHFYFNTMKYITKEKERYKSPMPKDGSEYAKKRKGESGEWFEEKFFGRHIKKLSFKESIFILNMRNYNKGLNDFKKELSNISKKELKPEDIIEATNGLSFPEEFKNSNIDLDSSYSLNIGQYDLKELELTVGEDVFFYDVADETEKFKKEKKNYFDKKIEKIESEIIAMIRNKKKQ